MQEVHYQKVDDTSHCISDFHNSFSEHLSTHRTLELWPQPMYKVNQDFKVRPV